MTGNFMRFDPDNNFASPVRNTTIAGGAAGKWASYYDPIRRQLYYFTYANCDTPCSGAGGNFFTLSREGDVLSSRWLVTNSPVLPDSSPARRALLQYPHLEMAGSRLYAAWTNVDDPLDPPPTTCRPGRGVRRWAPLLLADHQHG
jgi:hypothetical protein